MSDRPDGSRHVVVLGGGITGLAAAWEASGHPGVEVTVLEASSRLGGKVRTSTLDLPTGPLVVDEGADNFLARVPDAVDLCTELGLADELTQPALGRAEVWAGGALRWYPRRHVLGVPLDVDDLAATGILSDEGLAAVATEVDRTDPAPDGDVPIGAFLADRFGRELVEHVVGPLVGGINAGDVDELSMRAVTPQLADAAADGGSLTLALRRRVAAAPPSGPVFRALLGGTERMVDVLADRLAGRGADLRTGVAATAVGRDPDGGVVVGTADGAGVRADAVVVALPAPAASTVLGAISPTAAAELGALEHVPVAFVAFAVPRAKVPVPLDASGVLVPRDAGLLMTATSFGSVKWPHWDDGTHVILRVAAGHRHDERPSTMDDEELVAALRADLATVLGITAAPVATRVTRWSPGFAQYEVGHLDRVRRIDAALAADAPAVRVAGADLGGLGLPACIRQGRDAARALVG
ncbi:protoporphyrinogen oxidase [Dermatobacter hominis]|uniref:protoporphyrinogen oxidase n=1 Tax=Dermatobacter hominis TaxID=2884263 RepID=UPI001D113BB4|nr:protoporphyrinogen oxidase [Dermatobacter hominis]UDY34616.1 protoporphyrinogen oxidase [Dermatobacter hominis]